MRNLKLGFIGLGLIGGSIAKAAKQIHENITIIAYNRSEKSRILAQNDHVADIVTDTIDERFSDCDYIFLCTPVEQNIRYLTVLKDLILPTCIITDVGSVKQNIHLAIEQLGLTKHFIGGHPMAGSEKTGYENASSHLLENAYYILTPTANVSRERVNELYEIIRLIGAIPIILDDQEHDFAVAAISHVPHLIAACLVNLVKDNDSEDEIMKLLAAGGFKDITRIASSSPDMWQQICSTNKDNIVLLLDKYIHSLQQIMYSVNENSPNAVYDLFTKSRAYRDSFSENNHGPIQKIYSLSCDIIDESGAIRNVANILADNKISIKNIGIVNNREYEGGVLKIQFHDKNTMELAGKLLSDYGYVLYPN
ncbi:MAG: prephenate dehydrogenase [Lachnospiraceae bacterium]|nr:prephenate dehydrogenase [Lachnospiraceae bacterium]